MPVIRKEYPCGCCIGITVACNRMRSTGVLVKCLICTDASLQSRINVISAYIKIEPKASKYLAAQDISLPSILQSSFPYA
jgi:hypothetical protein